MMHLARTFLLAVSAFIAGCTTVPENRLREQLQAGVRHGYPGMAMIVRELSGEVHGSAAGYSDLTTRAPLRLNDGFHIGSVTKTFTAVAALRLVDSGKLSLSDTITSILGDSVARIPNADRITVAQLLDHSSGIHPTNNEADYISTMLGPNADPTRIWTPQELVAFADRDRNPPAGTPGAGHWYSDTNYILLGMIVEKVTGEPLRTTVARTLLQPLGMDHTYYYSDKIRGLVGNPGPASRGYLIYTDDIRGVVKLNPMFPKVDAKLTKLGPVYDTTLASERIDAAGGIISTLPDLAKFADALFHGRLVSPASQNFLTAAATGMDDLPLDKHRTWAMQSVHKPYGVLLYKEGDGPGGSTALMSYHPATDQIFIGFTNSIGYFDEVNFMIDKVIPTLLKSPSDKPL